MVKVLAGVSYIKMVEHKGVCYTILYTLATFGPIKKFQTTLKVTSTLKKAITHAKLSESTLVAGCLICIHNFGCNEKTKINMYFKTMY